MRGMRPHHALAAIASLVLACSSTQTTPQDAGPTYAAPYTRGLLDDARIGSDSNKPNFQKATADVQLEGTSFAEVKLVVDLTSTCFPFEKWTTNPPPAVRLSPACGKRSPRRAPTTPRG